MKATLFHDKEIMFIIIHWKLTTYQAVYRQIQDRSSLTFLRKADSWLGLKSWNFMTKKPKLLLGQTEGTSKPGYCVWQWTVSSSL